MQGRARGSYIDRVDIDEHRVGKDMEKLTGGKWFTIKLQS